VEVSSLDRLIALRGFAEQRRRTRELNADMPCLFPPSFFPPRTGTSGSARADGTASSRVEYSWWVANGKWGTN